MKLHLVGLVLSAVILCGSLAQATVFWDDEMESGNSGYNLNDLVSQGAVGAITFDTSVKFSGSGSMRYNFGPECYPDASAQANCGGFLDRSFTSTTDFYRRVYFRMSAGFTVSDIYTKMFRSDTTDAGTYSNWWVMGDSGAKDFLVALQNIPVGDTTNVGANFTFADSTWYCIETREGLNTPGVANGTLTVWIDGVQVLNLTNIMYRDSGNTNTFNSNRMYRQTGIGNLWFDRLAVGDARIGCLGAGSGGGPIVMFITQSAVVIATFLQVLFIGGYFWERRTVAVHAAVKFWRYAADVPTPKEFFWAYRYKKAVKRWQQQAPLMLEHQPLETLPAKWKMPQEVDHGHENSH